MSLHKDPELKKAVLSLPPAEKEKLLVRLVSKDRMLLKQLRFQLLEDETDLDERITSVHKQLEQLFERLRGQIRSASEQRNAVHLVGELRYASGLINEHVTITKDKMSDVQLRLFLVSQSFAHFGRLFGQHPYGHNRKLLEYQSGRLKYILGKYAKLHEDLQFEFRDELNTALAFAHASGMASYMQALDLPKEID